MYQEFGISKEIEELSTKVEKDVESKMKEIEETCTQNSLKVLQAFQNNEIAEMHFQAHFCIVYGVLCHTNRRSDKMPKNVKRLRKQRYRKGVWP